MSSMMRLGKRPTFVEGVIAALAASLAISFSMAVFDWVLPLNFLIRVLIGVTGFAYLLYLFSRGQEKSGRITALSAYVLMAFCLWIFMPSMIWMVIAHLGFIWLIRSLYFYNSVLSALLDLGLTAFSLVCALAAYLHTNSVFLGLWSLFLTQALFVWIPTDWQLRSDGHPSPLQPGPLYGGAPGREKTPFDNLPLIQPLAKFLIKENIMKRKTNKLVAIALMGMTVATVALYPSLQSIGAVNLPVTHPVIVRPHVIQQQPSAKIDVVFVLDTTGSMSGLIRAAKEKIWSIASSMAQAKHAPQIRMGLVAYRDKGDAYVTQVTDLSTDLDSMYAKLMDFKAQGGGDGPEHVNQALYDAVHKMSWSQSDAYKVVFLVGDAEPHMDYQDDVKYPTTLRAALKKGIVVNAIQSGTNIAATKGWRKIARLGQGEYSSGSATW